MCLLIIFNTSVVTVGVEPTLHFHAHLIRVVPITVRPRYNIFLLTLPHPKMDGLTELRRGISLVQLVSTLGVEPSMHICFYHSKHVYLRSVQSIAHHLSYSFCSHCWI